MSAIFNTPQHLSGHVRNPRDIKKGLMLLGKRASNFERAVVLRVEVQTSAKPRFLVRYIDYGDKALLAMDQLRFMPDGLKRDFEQLPPRMFECRLALIQPSSLNSMHNRWPNAANEMLASVAKCGRIELEIYSLVDNVAAVLLHMRDGLLNEKLVERQLARRADEDYMSRKDHDFRMRKQETKRYLQPSELQHINEEYLRFVQIPEYEEIEPPPLQKCNLCIHIKGPFSPLETNLNSLIRIGLYKTVSIDRESVNAVLLDSDPQDHHDQMVVASSVSEIDGDRLNTFGTTLMPNIHGFGALMTMLFCPTMQIKCNAERTKYVCILAGLGYDPETMEPYFEEHDLVVNLDVNILKGDIRIVSGIRRSFKAACTDLITFLYR